MVSRIRVTLGLLTILLGSICTTLAADSKDETVDNPFYKGWASSKVGSTVTHRETVRFPKDSPESKDYPDGISTKDVTYTLLELTPEKAVVKTVVLDYEFFSTIEAAPTKITYPAKVKKTYLAELMSARGIKEGDEEIEALGKTYKCHTYEATIKSDSGVITRKTWANPAIPGGIVKRTNITHLGDKLVSEGTISVLKFEAK
jgi:hypothetical protein